MISGLSTSTMTLDGNAYVLTLDTGEMSYGRTGGSLAFAYNADDFAATAARVESYSELCDELSPVSDDEELRRIAIVAAAQHEYRVTVAGACTPVLSDDEYELVRATCAALAR